MGGHVIEAAVLLLLAFVAGCGIGYAARRTVHGGAGADRPAETIEEAAASAVPAGEPAATQLPPAQAEHRGPVYLDAPRGVGKDNLRRISGIGPKIERSLNEAGIYHFDQIAALSVEDQYLLDQRLLLRGRIQRDDWVGQALRLLEADASA